MEIPDHVVLRSGLTENLTSFLVLLLAGIATTYVFFIRRRSTRQTKDRSREHVLPDYTREAQRSCYRCGKVIAPGNPVYHVCLQDQGPYEEMLVFMCEDCYSKASKESS